MRLRSFLREIVHSGCEGSKEIGTILLASSGHGLSCSSTKAKSTTITFIETPFPTLFDWELSPVAHLTLLCKDLKLT